MHLAQERHEYGRLARARGPDDEVEAARVEDDVVRDAQAEGLLRCAWCGGRGGPCELGAAEAYFVLVDWRRDGRVR